MSLLTAVAFGAAGCGVHVTIGGESSPAPSAAASTAPGGPEAGKNVLHTSGSPAAGTIREYVDNHNGAPIFADQSGRAVPDGPSRLPFDTPVDVTCYRAGEIGGMPSVTGAYLVADVEQLDGTVSTALAGDLIVSDDMTNGGPRGNTYTGPRDPLVRAC
ncbi:MAG TPA: hypothetical protein VLF71_01655 [Candidatus Saccharimonadales bacterium]|nr:hypothetical protein [Candidatus Saccharimonadales bacterium]